MISEIKVGDFADVRAVVMAREGNTITVRIPGTCALHQIDVGAHAIQNVTARSPEAIAADVVFNSYAAHSPQSLGSHRA
jgi:hypothetical protein